MVNFKITVTNTGNTAISQVDIKDIFPQFIIFAAGAGNFDQNSKTFSFSALNLNPSEQRTFVVTGKVVPNNQLPNDKGIVCVVNQVTAANGNQQSQDNAEFCIQKQVEQVTTKGGLKVFPPSTTTTTPSTGPEMLSLLALIPSGLMGLFLRKKSTK